MTCPPYAPEGIAADAVFQSPIPREPEKPPVFICRDRKPRAETDP